MKKCLFVLIGFLCLNLNAQVQKEIFESFKLQERRDVSYYFPENYSDEKLYPLIIVLDADYLFDLVVANVKFQSNLDRMPEAIVVGIHQSENDLRWDDCDWEDGTGLPTDKGKKFYEFLGTELIPYMATTYKIAPFKMFVGYDITANFGNYYLFKDNSFFNSFVSISPVLAPEMENRVPERLSALNQTIFYNLIVEKAPSEDRQLILQMNHSIKSIEKESLHYFFDEYEDADHESVVAYGISKAFDNVFKIYRPITPEEYKTEIVTSEEPVFNYLENRYNTIEDLFGFEKQVELNDIMAIYAACIKKQDYESLKPLADLCKKEFPETMMGFYFEAEHYEFMGEPKKAFKAFEKAFQMEEIDFLTKDLALEKIDALKADFGW
ncbi:alpha/beta hydrolase [Allomuricauda sp. NBRC 101325]|uniref:alpha/beta hydrolase n=1 Tax=Allomuricauda sp. NBRC 101325 TaxID=1113758 RepID=UPI0025567CE3|nr:alpha/beta hydrolase-fold protein [Muricauda sp. NBRC 101325]